LGGDVYFLTDKEIYKDYQKRVGKIKDNDPLGHGAIRAYYGIPDRLGTEYEEQDFWRYKYPEKIQKCVDNFDVYYSRTFDNLLQDDDLCYIVENAPEKWKLKVFDILEYNRINNCCLQNIIISGKDEDKSKAWEILITKNKINYDLRHISLYSQDHYRKKASEFLLSHNPSDDDLKYMIVHSPYEYRVKSCEFILNNSPNYENLRYVSNYAPKKFKKKSQKMLSVYSSQHKMLTK
jgi:hypothetical protein